MFRADCLEIRFGVSHWLKVAQALAASLGLLAILITPANWKWKLCGILMLLLMTYLLHTRSSHPGRSGRIRLFTDGTATVRTACGQEIYAMQGAHSWVSRWLSVLTLCEANGGRRHYCVICARANHPDEYRRLLKLLRMHTPPAETQRMSWS